MVQLFQHFYKTKMILILDLFLKKPEALAVKLVNFDMLSINERPLIKQNAADSDRYRRDLISEAA